MSSKSFYSLNANSILIRTDKDMNEFETISYHDNRCKNDSTFWLIIIIVSCVIVILIIIISVLVIVYYRKSSQKRLEVIMPEPRTYRQTQIIMQVENCNLLKTDF
jgi:heme/copper-type cytochrome/quinol oxidase subunit 2